MTETRAPYVIDHETGEIVEPSDEAIKILELRAILEQKDFRELTTAFSSDLLEDIIPPRSLSSGHSKGVWRSACRHQQAWIMLGVWLAAEILLGPMSWGSHVLLALACLLVGRAGLGGRFAELEEENLENIRSLWRKT